MITGFWSDRETSSVPLRALLLSVLAFSVPVMGATIAPDWALEEQGFLLWLTPLVPPFLITYYKGWGGASIGLAGGMAALVSTHLGVLLLGLGQVDYTPLFGVIATYIVVCVGAGASGELLRRERASAREWALTDRQTGLPNHRHAAVFLDAAFSGAGRGQPVSIVLFSLDDFEKIGGRFGEETSEQVLRRFAAILTESTRRMDLSARWHSQVFVSVLSRCKAGGAAAFANRVHEELRADVYPWGKVTISAGIAEFDPEMGSLEILVAAADRALNTAREEGGDRHVIAGTRSEAFADRIQPRIPSTQRGGLRLESTPERGFQLVPVPSTVAGDPDTRSAAAPRSSGRLVGGRETIMIVNDDSSERSALARLLSELGYRALVAPNPEEALERAGDRMPPDLIVADLVMPSMSGFTLADRFETQCGPQRVLYLCGHVQGEISWRGAPGSGVGFVSKPMYDAEVAQIIRGLLDTPLDRSDRLAPLEIEPAAAP